MTPSAAPAPAGSAAAPAAVPAPAPADPAATADAITPLEGETAQQFAQRLQEAGVNLKRTSDAQREMHRATTEASTLRTEIEAIGRSFGPPPAAAALLPQAGESDLQYVDRFLSSDTELQQAQAAVTAAWEAYQKANDEQGPALFRAYEDAKEARSELRIEKKQQARYLAHQAEQRQIGILTAHNKAITAHVTKIAPDVKPSLFWKFSRDAERETPAEITGTTARLEWQINRAIAMVRAEIDSIAKPASDAAAEAAAHAASARVVMPGGGAVPPAVPARAPEAPKSFAESAKAGRARYS